MVCITANVFQDTLSAEETKTKFLLHFLSLGIPKPDTIQYYDFFIILSLLPVSPVLTNVRQEQKANNLKMEKLHVSSPESLLKIKGDASTI